MDWWTLAVEEGSDKTSALVVFSSIITGLGAAVTAIWRQIVGRLNRHEAEAEVREKDCRAETKELRERIDTIQATHLERSTAALEGVETAMKSNEKIMRCALHELKKSREWRHGQDTDSKG